MHNNLIMLLIKIIILVTAVHSNALGRNDQLTLSVVKAVNYKKRLPINIGANGVNRISFAPYIITNIWGDASEYSATLSSNGSELFVTSKLAAGKKIILAAALAGGRIIDLILHTKEGGPKIIELDLQVKQHLMSKEDREAEAMLKAMRQGLRGKYYIEANKNQFIVESYNDLVAKQEYTYRFGNLRGVALKLYNRGREEISIDLDKLLHSFEQVVALQIEHNILTSKKQTKAFIIVRGGE